jgi:hypothetical protein
MRMRGYSQAFRRGFQVPIVLWKLLKLVSMLNNEISAIFEVEALVLNVEHDESEHEGTLDDSESIYT